MKPFNHSEEDAVKKLLEEAAEQIKPNAAFTADLEKQLKQTHRPKADFNMSTVKKIISPVGWSLALIALAMAFNWIASQIAPKTVPGSNGPTEEPAPFSQEGTPVSTISTPAGQVYQWNEQSIYLNATLPETPSEMKIYLQQNEVIARVEDVQALAQKFGMNGEIYQVPGEVPNTTDYLMVDENQQLRVRSDRYFTYYPNYAEAMYAFNTQKPPDHKALIDAFMQTHGLGSEYKIERSELYGGYLALPLTPDGFTVRHEHFASNGYLFDFNGNGILRVRSSLLRYEEVGTAAVISAEEALDKLLDPSTLYGVTSATHSPNPDGLSWRRVYPLDQTLTYYGFLRSTARSITGGPALITLDEYQVSGNVQNIPENMPNTFVEATGQFHEQEGVRTFEIQTWAVYEGSEEGHQGTIQQQNGQTVFITTEGDTLNISDPPSDISLPVEGVYIIGVTRDGEFVWKSIDTRSMSGGGGGGGGLGFYNVNLSGTPMPLPTNIPLPETPIAVEPTTFEGQRGILGVTITNQTDGSQRIDYWLSTNHTDYQYLLLEGENLESLQDHHNRPLEIWGMVDRFNENGNVVVKVDRFEIPFPDLQIQILKGTQETTEANGQAMVIFRTEAGDSYIQFDTTNNGPSDPVYAMIGAEGDSVMVEALIIPDESFGGYPVIRIFSGAVAAGPDGEEMTPFPITADQPYIVDELIPSPMNPPTMSIEQVELAYFTPDRRYSPTSDPGTEPPYLQPVWIFSGHYSDGSEFQFIIQALKDEHLSPQIQPARAPG